MSEALTVRVKERVNGGTTQYRTETESVHAFKVSFGVGPSPS